MECAILHFAKPSWVNGILNKGRMVEHNPISTATPIFSIIIAVYGDWTPLDQCLRSLEQQINGPSFEVIVIDDGSNDEAPESIRRWDRCYPLTIVRQGHAGVSAARNRGAQISKGMVLLFVDADSKLQTDCLAMLGSAITRYTQHNYFQLHLTGDRSGIVGKAEELRLITLQNHLLQPDGRIRYLNTAGFALRRTRADIGRGLFDPVAVRAEDTLLLANLMQAGELPLFVPDAVVQHAIPLSLTKCLLKDVRFSHLDGTTYDLIASKGVKLRVTPRERLRMLASMWKTSRQPTIGRLAWFVLAARQTLRLFVLFLRSIRLWRSSPTPEQNRIPRELHDKTASK